MDWIDPNTWKLPAELIGYAQAIIVGIVAIVGTIATIFLKPLRWFRSRTKTKVEQKGISLSKTICIVVGRQPDLSTSRALMCMAVGM